MQLLSGQPIADIGFKILSFLFDVIEVLYARNSLSYVIPVIYVWTVRLKISKMGLPSSSPWRKRISTCFRAHNSYILNVVELSMVYS